MRRFLVPLILVGCASPPRVVPTPIAPAIVGKPAPAAKPVAATPAPQVEAPQTQAPVCEPLPDEGDVATIDAEPPLPEIVDESGEGLAHFRKRLAALVRGRATDHVRIGVWGDSNMTMDWITGEMRRVLQKKYGDGGHGFVAFGRPWNWYRHQDVDHGLWLESFISFAISTAPAMDGHYGFAGIAAQTLHPGARAWIGTTNDLSAPIGKSVSSADLYYLERPNAGRFDLRVDGKTTVSIDARAPDVNAAFHHIDLPDGPHKFEVVATTHDPVRLFGMVLERGTPSVVVDSLGVGASNSRLLTKQTPAIARATLARRKYDLVVFLIDTGLWSFEEEHASIVKQLVALHREAHPGVSILLMSPPDHALSLKATKSDDRVVRLGKWKKKAAVDNRVAFWDFREAMGGEMSMMSFYRRSLAWNDLIHFNQKGAALMGNRIVAALMRDLKKHGLANPSLGCDAE